MARPHANHRMLALVGRYVKCNFADSMAIVQSMNIRLAWEPKGWESEWREELAALICRCTGVSCRGGWPTG